MPRVLHKTILITVVLLSGLILSGCFLRSMFGNVIFVDNIADNVNEIITTVFSDSTAAVCASTDYGFYECTYIVGGDIITSSFYLLSEYGLWGVVIDPVVVQTPADAILLEATYDDGSGPKDLLVWTQTSFQAQPGITITAETGYKFFILEFPASVAAGLPVGNPASGAPFDFTFRYQRNRPIAEPVTNQSIKVMFTGKVMVNGHNYFPPLLPCTTSFAGIPSLEIPLSQNQVNLLAAVHTTWQANPPTPCDHQGYYFSAAPPKTPPSLFLPVLVH